MAKLQRIPRLPQVESCINFMGTYSTLPESAIMGEVVRLENGEFFVRSSIDWIPLVRKNEIIPDLTEVLDRYPNSLIAEDIRKLLKLYEKRAYA